MAKIKWTDLSGLQQEFLNNLNECQKRMPEHEFIPLSALSRSKGGTRQSLVYKGLVQRAQVDYGYRYKLTDAGRALLPATAPTAAALEAYPDLYRSGDYSVYYDPEYQEYIVASGGGDPLSARKTLDEAKAIADAYASEGDKAEPTAAAQGEVVPASVDDLSPAQKEVWVRLALNQADVQIASLEAALQQAQRERDAANELLAKIERRMPMVQPFDLGVHYYSETYNAWLVGDWIRAYQKAASAQQAAQPADGEG